MTKKQMAIVPIEDVEVGTKLKADGGFTCLCEGEIVTVEKDENGDLFFYCAGADDDGGPNSGAEQGKPATVNRNEKHGLDGQTDEDGEYYVGFYLVQS